MRRFGFPSFSLITVLGLIAVMVVFLCCPVFAQERLYIVQGLDESLGKIELSNGNVNQHVLDLGYGCNDILLANNKLYVTNSLLNTVQEIDPVTNTTLRDIPVTGCQNPYSSALLNPDTLVVTNWVSNNVALIRLSDGTVVGTIPVGLGPEGILMHDSRVFVCLTRYLSFGDYGPGVVMVYDRTSLALIDSIRVGTDPQSMAVDDQNRLHVVCTGNYGNIPGSISVVDLETLVIDTTLSIGGTPTAVSFGGGYAFIAAGGWAGHGEVLRYRLSDLDIVNDQAHALPTGLGATDVEARTDGSFYVSCFSDATIEHRSATGQLLQSFPVSTGPGQMVLFSEANAVPGDEKPLPSQTDLIEAFPNPFNSAVTFSLATISHEMTNINIYNSIGQMVDQLVIAPGRTSIVWSPRPGGKSSASSGTYYAVWGVSGQNFVKKVVYLK
jgi:YVTN family beta-propeller protein